jgi:molybdopterin synthase sulfur carrier subunit
MTIIVKMIGALRHISGKNQLNINYQECTSLKELINTITEEKPELKLILINQSPDDSKANTLILVNGREISVLNGLETKLNDGDEIVFIPVVHGG